MDPLLWKEKFAAAVPVGERREAETEAEEEEEEEEEELPW